MTASSSAWVPGEGAGSGCTGPAQRAAVGSARPVDCAADASTSQPAPRRRPVSSIHRSSTEEARLPVTHGRRGPDTADVLDLRRCRGRTVSAASARDDAPPALALVVELVDLEGQYAVAAVGPQEAVRRGADDDRVVHDRVVDRHDVVRRRRQRDPPGDARTQQALALGAVQVDHVVHGFLPWARFSGISMIRASRRGGQGRWSRDPGRWALLARIVQGAALHGRSLRVISTSDGWSSASHTGRVSPSTRQPRWR